MKIFKNLFGKGDKIAASEIADEKGRLASESIIVDSGYKEGNGYYLLFADGTMVQHFSAVNNNGTFSTGWTYAKIFADVPTVSATVSTPASTSAIDLKPVCNLFEVTNAKATVHAFDSATNKAYSKQTIHFFAMGRWK